MLLLEEHSEYLQLQLENRHQQDLAALQEKNEGYEFELKKKFEGQSEEWSWKSWELTKKIVENQRKPIAGK